MKNREFQRGQRHGRGIFGGGFGDIHCLTGIDSSLQSLVGEPTSEVRPPVFFVAMANRQLVVPEIIFDLIISADQLGCNRDDTIRMLLEVDDVCAAADVGTEIERNCGMPLNVVARAQNGLHGIDTSVRPRAPFVFGYRFGHRFTKAIQR